MVLIHETSVSGQLLNRGVPRFLDISDVKRLNRLIQLTAKDINSKKYLQLSMDK